MTDKPQNQNSCICGEGAYRYDRRALDNKVKLLCGELQGKKYEHESMWNSINKRVPYYVFFTVIGGLFIIVIGLMGIVYSQGSKTQSVVMEMHSEVAKVSQIASSNADSVRKIERDVETIRKQQ